MLATSVSVRLSHDEPQQQQHGLAAQSPMHPNVVMTTETVRQPRRQMTMDQMSIHSTDGGIIFFVHIIKTGGTTIRDNFSNKTLFPQVDYMTINSLKDFRKAKLKIDSRLHGQQDQQQQKSKGTLFVEVHGHNTPTLVELEQQLREWKSKAEAIQLRFFAFTLLRDPLDFTISFFNFFHVYGDPRFGPPIPGTLSNLRATLPWNPQCLYLMRGERPFFRPDHFYNVTPLDCDEVARIMDAVLDWVGDTRQLSTETLPLLIQLILGSTATSHHALQVLANKMKSSNVAATRQQRHVPLSKSQLDAPTIHKIYLATRLDQKLYQQCTDSLIVP